MLFTHYPVAITALDHFSNILRASSAVEVTRDFDRNMLCYQERETGIYVQVTASPDSATWNLAAWESKGDYRSHQKPFKTLEGIETDSFDTNASLVAIDFTNTAAKDYVVENWTNEAIEDSSWANEV